MRIIPKKVKVKNTVWKCYSMIDVIVALVVFAIIFIAVTAGSWAMAIIMGLIAVVMFMPTPDGILYTCIFDNIKFLFAKKKYAAQDTNPKSNISALTELKEIKANGILVYNGGMYGRVIKIGQKYSYSRNFDESEIKDIPDDRLVEWVKPKEVVFHANK